MKKWAIGLFFACALSAPLEAKELAAKLNNAPGTLKRFFPGMESYTVKGIRLDREGGFLEFRRLQDRLGGKMYAPFDRASQPHLIVVKSN